jgi:glycosyltransferase involved in cell wall biosynthesis
MKIGVAIPCYNGHINQLYVLLDSIEKQTILPDKVVVSTSSTKEFKNNNIYSFPLEIIAVEEKNNAAKNRNRAASFLTDMDYITFIDADDVMHPQRIEILLNVFKEHDSDIILHNYFDNNCPTNEIFKNMEYTEINVRINSLRQHCSGCIEHINYIYKDIEYIHHSQVSVKNDILKNIKFPEEVEFNRREDCIFCHRVFNLPNIKNAYIVNKLSHYIQSYTEF